MACQEGKPLLQLFLRTQGAPSPAGPSAWCAAAWGQCRPTCRTSPRRAPVKGASSGHRTGRCWCRKKSTQGGTFTVESSTVSTGLTAHSCCRVRTCSLLCLRHPSMRLSSCWQAAAVLGALQPDQAHLVMRWLGAATMQSMRVRQICDVHACMAVAGCRGCSGLQSSIVARARTLLVDCGR